MNENDILRVEHKRLLKEVNEKVSNCMNQTEEFTAGIAAAERDNEKSRRKFVKQLAKVLEETKKNLGEAQLAHQAKKCAYQEKARDLEDLVAFEKAAGEDPTMVSRQIDAELQRKTNRFTEMENQLKQYDFILNELKKEIDYELTAKGATIIEDSLTVIEGKFEQQLIKLMGRNQKLKLELQNRLKLKSDLEEDIKSAQQKRKDLIKENKLAIIQDPRRRTNRYKEYMTCTPEMEPTIC